MWRGNAQNNFYAGFFNYSASDLSALVEDLRQAEVSGLQNTLSVLIFDPISRIFMIDGYVLTEWGVIDFFSPAILTFLLTSFNETLPFNLRLNNPTSLFDSAGLVRNISPAFIDDIVRRLSPRAAVYALISELPNLRPRIRDLSGFANSNILSRSDRLRISRTRLRSTYDDRNRYLPFIRRFPFY